MPLKTRHGTSVGLTCEGWLMRAWQFTVSLLLLCVFSLSGCLFPTTNNRFADSQLRRPVQSESKPPGSEIHQVSYQDVENVPAVRDNSVAPPTVSNEFSEPWPITVDEAVQIALKNNPGVRASGIHVLAHPQGVRTVFDPMLAESDPRFGPQAALSAFDTQLETGLFWNGGSQSVNGAGGDQFGVFPQPQTLGRFGVGRVFESGTQALIGGVGGYDSRVAPATGVFAALAASVRHPLLQGSGKNINYIAGPNAQPGVYRGVWIARLDSDKTLVDVEKSVRDLVREVLTVYWELYFAYQHLETKKDAKANALESWELEKKRVEANVSPADFEALARQQYYAAEASVHNALSGTGSNSTGVYAVELKLRRILGLCASDGRLLQPISEPLTQEIQFAWGESLQRAHTCRVELRRQRYEVHKRELELVAAHDFDRFRADLVGQYRLPLGKPQTDGDDQLLANSLQGWQVGLEVTRSLGNRRGKAAVENAKIRLRREQVILSEQRQEIDSQIRAAFTELARAFAVMRSYSASRDGAAQHLKAESSRHAAGDADLDRVLQAQLRATQAQTAFFRALVDYNLAFINLHFARGSLLESMSVRFSETAPTPDRVAYSMTSTTPYSTPTNVANRQNEVQPAGYQVPRTQPAMRR